MFLMSPRSQVSAAESSFSCDVLPLFGGRGGNGRFSFARLFFGVTGLILILNASSYYENSSTCLLIIKSPYLDSEKAE